MLPSSLLLPPRVLREVSAGRPERVRLIMINETFSRSLRRSKEDPRRHLSCWIARRRSGAKEERRNRNTILICPTRRATVFRFFSAYDMREHAGRCRASSAPGTMNTIFLFLRPPPPPPGVRDNGSLGCKGRARPAKEVPHGRPGRIAGAPLCIVKLS